MKLIIILLLSLFLNKSYSAKIYADTYGWNASDATIAFYDAIYSNLGSGDTVIFKDMGSPWLIGAGFRIFDANDLTIIFEPGCVIKQKNSSQGGFWNNPGRSYNGISHLRNYYPGGTLNVNYRENQSPKLIWLLRANNFHVIAHGAEFIGSYPYDNPGNNPATTTNAVDNTYEYGHFFQILEGANNSAAYPQGVTWKGGYIHNFAGDGINISSLPDSNGFMVIEDVKVEYCKRLGISYIQGVGKAIIKDCIISNNGQADVAPYWGTNTRHGFTAEPNNADETVNIEMYNCQLSNNADAGIGLHTSAPENRINNIIMKMVFSGIHLENNSQQVDYTPSSAIHISGADLFNTTKGGDANTGTNPLGGYVNFSDIAVFGDVHGFITSNHYERCYKVKFDNTVVYKMSTLNDQKMAGDAICEFSSTGDFASNTKIGDINFGDILVIHDKSEPFIMVNDNNDLTEISPTLKGNLTMVSPSNLPSVMTKNTSSGIINNNTINKTYHDITTFQKNIVSVNSGVDAIKSINQTGTFIFERTGDTSYPMAIYYTINTSGLNSEMMVDFKLLRGSIIIPRGQYTSVLEVKPINEYRKGGDRLINLTIQPKQDLYVLSNPSSSIFLKDSINTNNTQGYLCKNNNSILIDGIEEIVWTDKEDTIKNIISGVVNNMNDCFGTFKLMWDINNLYILVKITDDTLINESTEPWKDDGIEIFIDGGNEKLNSYDANDRHYIFRWNDLNIYEYGNNTSINPPNINFNQINTANGYQMEIKIPWLNIGVVPYDSMVFGFDIQINDDDNGGNLEKRRGFFAMSSAFSNPSIISSLLLKDSNCYNTTSTLILRDDFMLFPNPTTGEINIKLNDLINKIEVYNLLGKLIYLKEYINAKAYTINLSDLPKGIYSLKVYGVDKVLEKQIIKQ